MRNLLARVQVNIGRQLLLNDLVATIETDFEEYGRVVDEATAWHDKRVAPTDPDHNTLGPKNAFWTCIRDDEGDVVSCSAQRIWKKTRLVDLINSGRFLYDGSKDEGQDSLHLFTEGLGHIEGNIAYCGGGWVHPKVRGKAISTMSIMLSQAKLLQDFDVDYCFSMVRQDFIDNGMALKTYRYYHMDYGATLWRAGAGERFDLWILHNSRADLLREMTLWMAGPG
ncbi:MAG: hypothetical protein HN478_13510 [Rhodospirillaceae bacterium]|nr:hypothetical protein [Rhodospirillaceae bacterium]MBT4044320.1 hypothetical protein [Rhodospirillaceae bacterium]MBT4487105.1 hypothetical protein [Rhodospirillaceae bacterium]MBT5195101.1 hypothetical protein [Rhodospirillaceae bacterium]MBT5894423.1 hypothetical protein [Rhodospirillaceae bacterium]